ncbi:MAG: hypothetical protein P8I93_03915 [Crocinitomicaceae bacterium]|nr:hypothetical protein [Crocinitomicaceae bacterium]
MRIISFLLFFLFLNAQVFYSQVSLKMDQKIFDLIDKRIKHNKIGYRLHLSFEIEKSIIDKKRIEFINKCPQISSYVVFRTPYFYLDVGDFRTKQEAIILKEQLKVEFPLSSIVKEKINLPSIE